MSNRIAAFAAVAALAFSATAASAQDAGPTASTVDRPAATIGRTPADAAAAYGAGTVGAMHYAVAGVATSMADVQRESRGLLTVAPARFVAAPQQPGS